MSDLSRLVAVLGRGAVPADEPILRADDLGVVRGDGIFETMHVRDGAAWIVEDHLDRLQRSAARLRIPLPERDVLERFLADTIAAWGGREGAIRLTCTRGVEGGDRPTVFATVSPIGPAVAGIRRDGLTVVTATLGVAADARTDAPWLLGGAKTVSYAVHMASQRWAAEQGAGDVLWVSADGYALEAPTSSLVWLTGDTLYTVPAEPTGILSGTTAAWLLRNAGELGMAAGAAMIRPAELLSVDGVWLTSSVRGLAEITAIDGTARPRSDRTHAMAKLLGFPVD